MKRHCFSYSIGEVAPYIDWSYLLHAWGIGCNDMQATEEIIRDAKEILRVLDGKYCTQGIFALCDAKSKDDDIIIEGTTLPLLRQQHSNAGKYNLCLSDFISPKNDRIGVFATSIDAAFGQEYTNDEYRFLLAQTLADRLAEATAALLHKQVRTDCGLWGYAPDEQLLIEDLLAEKNQGIRPAIGYPSLPDQSIIFTVDRLLGLKDIGITLTVSGAMHPHASVCGLMIAHPAARYFAVGKIDREQLCDYARRRGTSPEEIARFLTKNLE